MQRIIPKLLIGLAISGLVCFGPGRVHADNEPSDNTSGGATTIMVNDPDGTGFIHNSDIDYWKVTNDGGYTEINISFHFPGSGPDSHILKVLGPNGTTQLAREYTDSNTYIASYTISNPVLNDYYYIVIDGNSADGNKSYTLSVTAPVTTFSPATQSMFSQGGQYAIQVMSTTSWTVSGLPSWASASPASGTGNAVVVVTVDANPTTSQRMADLAIGSGSHRLTQDGIVASTSINPVSKNVSHGSSSYTIQVMSTTSWSVSGVPSWAFVSPTSGSGNGMVTVNVQANPSSTARNAVIMIGGPLHQLSQEGKPVNLWDGALNLGNGVLRSFWFGTFNTSVAAPFIWHFEHGFIAVFGDHPSSIWLFTFDQGWMWTGNSTYPWMYRNSTGSWMYYDGITGNKRWFLNTSTFQWETYNVAP